MFIECKTYRLRGHVGPDDNIQGVHTDIRPESEYRMWKEKDPISNFEKKLLANEIMSENDKKVITDQIKLEIQDAFAFSDESVYPDEREVMKYVFK